MDPRYRTSPLCRCALTLLLVALLPACSVASVGDTRSPAPDLVQFETNSWGRIVSGWSMGASGAGAWWIRRNEDGLLSPVGPYTVTYHDFDAGAAGFAAIAGLLADLPSPAPIASDCEMFRSDDFYGTVRLTSQATTVEHAWNRGCEDADYAAYLGKLLAADSAVAAWGRTAPISRVESFDENGRGTGMEFPGP